MFRACGSLLLVSISLFSGGVFAQDRPCPMMACLDGLVLRVPPEHRWEPGRYDFFFKIDGRTVTCEGALPFKGCDDSNQSLRCDGEGVMITQSGCALPQEAHAYGDIMFPEAPGKVDVRILHNGEILINRTFSSTYETSLPNGTGCLPVCRSANAELFEIPN